MKAVVAAFNQEKALVGAFSVITNLPSDVAFEALVGTGGYLQQFLSRFLLQPPATSAVGADYLQHHCLLFTGVRDGQVTRAVIVKYSGFYTFAALQVAVQADDIDTITGCGECSEGDWRTLECRC